MDTKALEKFAQNARRQLHEQVTARLERVLKTDTGELRARSQAVADLHAAIKATSRQAVIEQVAYTWFNRFIALRYMDANHFTRAGVVSPATMAGGETFTQPEILQEAKQGLIDEDLPVDRQRVFDLLSGRAPAADPQQEAYRLLLVAACNQYHAVMPFLFEKIDDYTELLMPDDLLSARSVLHQARQALTEDVCRDVEVIGWLYQFYISEKKDAVIKAKKAISAANIPAATQLFTPNWIVRYLVQNSLGRLWLLNRPHSRLAEQMAFYIAPDQKSDFSEKSDFLTVDSPEDLRLCDPAVGSGHMLTYAFDLLYAIYEEEGYNPVEIPRLILQKNLVGLEIDERAGALAAFALVMKARAKDRRFFRRERETGGVQPNIVVLRPIAFTEAELDAEVDRLAPLLVGDWQEPARQMTLLAETQPQLSLSGAEGVQALRENLRHDLNLFREADNVGSLLRPQLAAAQLARLRRHVAAGAAAGQLQMFDEGRRKKALRALAQAEALARPYHVTVTNPPYLGNFNPVLKKFAQNNYPASKSDLFAMFMERCLTLVAPRGLVGMINMQSWMFLSSYEKLRKKLLKRHTIVTMAHLGARAFDSISGEVVSTTAFVLENGKQKDARGAFVRLVDGRSEAEKAQALLEAIRNPDCGWFYRATAVDFQKIPGSPIIYSVNNNVRETFVKYPSLDTMGVAASGIQTSNNDKYLKLWHEISFSFLGLDLTHSEILALKEEVIWLPHNKGGKFRRWYGNNDFVLIWDRSAFASDNKFQLKNLDYQGLPAATWSHTSSSSFSVRYSPIGHTFNVEGPIFIDPNDVTNGLGFLASNVALYLMGLLNPTLHFLVGNVQQLPYQSDVADNSTVDACIRISKTDWNSHETSWDFTNLPLLPASFQETSISVSYTSMRRHWHQMTIKMKKLEEQNNRLFIDAYGLQDELTPDVPLAEITLTCNPHYRYGSATLKKRNWAAFSEQFPTAAAQLTAIAADLAPAMPEADRLALEQRLLDDTMREFISYAVGCMFGRYSLDKPGLILANQGETVDDYVRKIASGESRVAGGEDAVHNSQFTIHDSQFPPDQDNAIPMLDGDWFADDITERFKKFLRVTFGDEHYSDNLAFIEAAIGRDIRSYFLRDFYDDHVKMYKKRPIYWLFSSPKGSFNVLIYMHRYRPDTVSVILNDYLRNFRDKLNATRNHLQRVERSASAGRSEKSQAVKEINQIDKILAELRAYEDDVLYPLATQQVQIDLDDGVKVNYNKFGRALKKVRGLSESS